VQDLAETGAEPGETIAELANMRNKLSPRPGLPTKTVNGMVSPYASESSTIENNLYLVKTERLTDNR
jgi:hypothetical protein